MVTFSRKVCRFCKDGCEGIALVVEPAAVLPTDQYLAHGFGDQWIPCMAAHIGQKSKPTFLVAFEKRLTVSPRGVRLSAPLRCVVERDRWRSSRVGSGSISQAFLKSFHVPNTMIVALKGPGWEAFSFSMSL